jgi:phage terminase large subunit
MIATAPRRMVVDLYPQQDDFVHDPKRYTAFIGGRNSGKTYSGSWKAFMLAIKGGLGCIAAPSFPQLEQGARPQFLARLNDTGIPYRQTRTSIELPNHDAEIAFVTLESESRVRGPNYAWSWVDEVEYVSDRLIWKALKGAVRDGPNPQLFVTSTPKGRRLVWDEWVVGKTAHHALYKATTFDNPFIDAEDYVAGLGYEGAFFEQEITADFVTFEGLVYPAFDRTTHVREVDTTGWATVLALDVGTRNPTALLTIRYAGDRIHVESELYQRGMSSDAITDAAVDAYKGSRADFLVIDPSSAGLIKSLDDRGIPARKADNAIIPGISRVTSAMSNLTVDPSCVNTIAEFESYAYPDGGKVEKDAPIKANDHAMDALRYAVMELVVDAPAVASAGVTQRSRWN